MDKIDGTVLADVIDVRFAFAGKIASVIKNPGDKVKIGDHLAALDRKELQILLDKELADYEKVRAEFEIFIMENPDPANDKNKYEKVKAQALLNASVKAVELAKINLDAADLHSPVNGLVLDNSSLRPGMHITPGSYSYRLLDMDSLVIHVEKNQDSDQFLKTDMKVTILFGESELTGTVMTPIPFPKDGPLIRIKPDNTEILQIGDKVVITLPPADS